MMGNGLFFLSPQPDTSLHCKTMDTVLVHHMLSGYASAFTGILTALPTQGWPG